MEVSDCETNWVFFIGFANNCISYSCSGQFDNLTGHELVGNDRLEKLQLINFESQVKFSSLGKVKKLRISSF